MCPAKLFICICMQYAIGASSKRKEVVPYVFMVTLTPIYFAVIAYAMVTGTLCRIMVIIPILFINFNVCDYEILNAYIYIYRQLFYS